MLSHSRPFGGAAKWRLFVSSRLAKCVIKLCSKTLSLRFVTHSMLWVEFLGDSFSESNESTEVLFLSFSPTRIFSCFRWIANDFFFAATSIITFIAHRSAKWGIVEDYPRASKTKNVTSYCNNPGWDLTKSPSPNSSYMSLLMSLKAYKSVHQTFLPLFVALH